MISFEHRDWGRTTCGNLFRWRRTGVGVLITPRTVRAAVSDVRPAVGAETMSEAPLGRGHTPSRRQAPDGRFAA